MANQTILWTALPNGYTDDRGSLRVSLLVSPRLQPDFEPSLGGFPDFVDWPATLARTRFTVHFGASQVGIAGNDLVGPTRVDDRLGLPASSVWKALLPKTTPVAGFKFRDLSQHAVLSYPAADMEALVRGLYSGLAASTRDQLPTASTFLNDPGWSALVSTVARNDEDFTDARTGIRDVARQFRAFKDRAFRDRNLRTNLARFQLFHTPGSTPRVDKYNVPPDDAKASAQWVGYEQTTLPAPNDFRTTIDFHRIVAAMNQYPTLLRRLGLVVDLLIASNALAPAANDLLWVEAELPPGAPAVERSQAGSPRTRTVLDPARFQPLPRPPLGPGSIRFVDGLLDLDPHRFSLMQADVDGAGMKVTNFARSLLTLRGAPDQQIDPVTKQPREIGAPALRNAGLMLVHRERGELLEAIIARQSAFNDTAEQIQSGGANPPPELLAEDVLRGFRIDIWDDVSRRWHSLCERSAHYDIDDGKVVVDVAAEEGTVRLAATTSADPASNPDIIWLHEVLVSWPGWSLCVPPPGKTIGHDAATREDPVTDAEPAVPPGIRLATAFKARPGSLPRLRYGRKYWIRARTVDLAGNSLTLNPQDFGPEQSRDNARSYLRYEPVLPPAIALVKPTPGTIEAPGEGESMERMAIRSFNDTPALNTVPTAARSRRFAVPSRTSQRDAEQHAMFDRAGVVDPAFFSMIVAKDESLPEETVLTAGPLGGGPPVETPYAAMVDGSELPYLPEPLAGEIMARLFDHPTFPSDRLIRIPLYDGTEWPNALPFTIALYENPGDAPRYDAATRTLSIPLPKAVRARLRLSARLTPDDLKTLGVWQWLTPAEQTQTVSMDGRTMTLEELAIRGQHWMLTPWRTVELVHAVQRPLITPEFVWIEIDRGRDDTFAVPKFVATCSIASTDRIDLQADWNEPIDDLAAAAPENRTRTDHAYSVKITDPKSYAGTPEYVAQAPDRIAVGRGFHDRVAPKRHEFHDTRYRRIEYWLEATTKFREFMPASLLTETVGGTTEPTEANIKVVGPKIRTWIPCSAPPPAPEVVFVVPTFGWVRSSDEQSARSWRRGGGLRVYLNRPWNASGYGEMLAVVVPGSGFAGDPNDEPAGQPLKNFITQWGNDPIWESSFVAGVAPRQSDFPLARMSPDPDGKWLPGFAPPQEADQPTGSFRTTTLAHPELRNPSPDNLVDVAPHDVFYDEERQLWYCDIEVSQGASYFPFIRLALARYQPVALETAHLSNVVLADFMPLVADRWLTVTHTRDSATRQVSVFGHTYAESSSHREAREAGIQLPDGSFIEGNASGVAKSSVVEVWVERFDPAFGEDFGWSREAAAVVQEGVPLPRPSPIDRVDPNLRAKTLLRHREFEAILDEHLIDHVFLTPVLWQGAVTVPDTTGAVRYRLAIAEYEEYLVDDETPYDRFPTRKGRRLVFVEHVELGAANDPARPDA